MKVDQKSPWYDDLHKRRSKVHDLLAGSDHMRKKGEIYLPRHPKEDPISYDQRCQMTFLVNFVKQAVLTFTSRPFSEPVNVDGADLPKEIQENIDKQGNDLHVFAYRAFEQMVADGIVFFYAAYPRLPEGSSRAEARARGARPYLVTYTADQLIAARFDDETESPAMVKIVETILEPDGEYGEEEVEQLRVFHRNRTELFRKREGENGKKEWQLHDEWPNRLGYIPIYAGYTNRLAAFQALPPVEDIADLNIAHYQSLSDLRHILHVAQVPILFRAGFNDDEGEMTAGPNTMVTTGNPDANMKWVEINGPGIEQGRKHIGEIEGSIRLMSWELLTRPARDRETATARVIDQEESQSALKAWALSFSNAIENAIRAMMEMDGQKWEGTVTLRGNFEIRRDPEALRYLHEAYSLGAITKRTYVEELRRHDVLDSTKPIEDQEGDLDGRASDRNNPGTGDEPA